VSELIDLLLTGKDQSQADKPNNLAKGHPIMAWASNLIIQDARGSRNFEIQEFICRIFLNQLEQMQVHALGANKELPKLH
jgi:hypothetical protein